jgi:tetratricopeptide (TPR) repeat protein
MRPLVHDSALVEGLPDLGRLFGGLSLPAAPALGDAGLERTRLFESVCRLLDRASARRPLALLLDDVHWADRGSLALLQYLVRGLAACPLLILLTYRDDEADPTLTGLLDGFRRAGALVELPVTGLPEPAVRELAAELLGGDAPPGLLIVLSGRSGGVPLFVSALVEALVDSGSLRQQEGRWALASDPPETLPAAVTELLRSRIERLSEPARAALEMVAICGAEAEHGLLRRLLPEDGLLTGLAELRGARLVSEEMAEGRVRYRPGHPLLAEVAYQLLPLAVRHRRHADVARAVRVHAPDRVGLLAQHVRRAGDEVDPGEALEVLRRAADEALARKGGDEALAHLTAARELAEALNRSDLVADLLDRTAEAYELAGDRERAVATWTLAAAHRDEAVERAARLQRAAQLEVEAGHYEQTDRLLAQAAQHLIQEPPCSVHVWLAVTRQHATFRWERADEIEEVTEQVHALALRLDLPEAWHAVHGGRCQAAFAGGRYAESRTHLSALLGLTDELPSDVGERARRIAFIVELTWGDLPAATRTARQALELAERVGVPSLRRAPLANLGTAAFFTGDWEEAMRRGAELLELARRGVSVRAEMSGWFCAGWCSPAGVAPSRPSSAPNGPGRWPDVPASRIDTRLGRSSSWRPQRHWRPVTPRPPRRSSPAACAG